MFAKQKNTHAFADSFKIIELEQFQSTVGKSFDSVAVASPRGSDGPSVPAVNPWAPAVPLQASRRHLILLCSTSFLRFTVPFCTPTASSRRQDFVSKFSKKVRG